MSEAVLAPVVCTVEIAAPRERVFELFTTPEHLVEWWPDAATFEAREGGRIELEFEGRGEVTGTVTRFEPPSGLAFTWVRGVAPDVVTRVDVDLTELEDGGTHVELSPHRLGGRARGPGGGVARDPRRRLAPLPRLSRRPRRGAGGRQDLEPVMASS